MVYSTQNTGIIPFDLEERMVLMSVYKDISKNKSKPWTFQVTYQDHGKRRRKHGSQYKTKKEAAAAESNFLAEASREYSGMTFAQVADQWISFTKETNTPRTHREKLQLVRDYLAPIANTPIEAITSLDITKMLKSPEIQGLSTNRKNKIHSILKGTFHYAVTFYDLPKNPMEVIPRFRKTLEDRMQKGNIYTPEDLERFLAAIPDRQEEYRNFFQFLFWTGMRLNEARSLTFRDIRNGSANLYRQFQEGKWTTLKTKNSERVIALNSICLEIVEKQKTKWKEIAGYNDSWFLFGGVRQLPDRTIERAKADAAKSAGLPEIRIHDFRHSHASYLIDKHVPLFKISRRLGHSSISITADTYGHLLPDDDDEIREALG